MLENRDNKTDLQQLTQRSVTLVTAKKRKLLLGRAYTRTRGRTIYIDYPSSKQPKAHKKKFPLSRGEWKLYHNLKKSSSGLLAETQSLNDGTVAFDIAVLKVVKEGTTLTYEFHK